MKIQENRLALLLAAMMVYFVSALPAAEGTKRPLPFHGTLAKVDKTAQTITLTGKSARQFQITAQTKITKDGKNATLSDAVVGEEVGGSYREIDGKRIAVSVRFGPKPAGK
jgi:hypothetical protein